MLEEGVQIMRQAWTEGIATFHGEHYDVDGAICRPLPSQEGGIPLWIAGGGEEVTLRITRRGTPSTPTSTAHPGVRAQSEILRGHCEAVGRDFSEITRSAELQRVHRA